MEKIKFWKTEAAAKKTEGTLWLYGVIASESWWGDEVTPELLRKDLEALGDIETLHVRINSPGGDVFAGQAIYTILRAQKARLIIHIDGIAASIASLIARAGTRDGDIISIGKGSMLMIHKPMAVLMGYFNALELADIGEKLDKIFDSLLLPAFSDCKPTEDELRAMFEAETWLSDAEALEHGFVDDIDEGLNMAAVFNGEKNLVINGVEVDTGAFKAFPESLAQKQEETAEPDDTEQPEEPELEKTQASKELAVSKLKLALAASL